MSLKKVGFWVSEKKIRKLNFPDEFGPICRDANIELVQIDLERPVEPQGPFDLILHKLTDVLARADQGHVTARRQLSNLQEYLEKHPETIVLDPLDNLHKIMDRYEQYKLVEECDVVGDGSQVFMPRFVEFTCNDPVTNQRLLQKHHVHYPLICKPVLAQAHQLTLIFNQAGLQDITPPCVAQSFINHNGVLYKIFVLGEHVFVVERPSIRNFNTAANETIYFNTYDVSGANSSAGTALTETNQADLDKARAARPSDRLFRELAHSIQAKIQLSLFGIDVVLEDGTGRCGVVDINAFPGYEGVSGFWNHLLELVLKTLERKNLVTPNHMLTKPASKSFKMGPDATKGKETS